MSKTKTRKIKKSKAIIIGILTIILTLGGIGVGFGIAALKNVPNIDSSNIEAFAVSSSVYDKNEEFVDKLQSAENREPVELENISPHMIDALLAVEDQRFYKHFGIDPFRIAGAAVANIKQGHIAQGGSTLTQQLVKVSMLDPKDKTLKRKIQEAVIAIKVENDYTKDEILNFYLNTVYFGEGSYGIEAAAKTFFSKSAKDLTIDEAALLAGVIQNPYNHSPVYNPENAEKRRAIVLNAMVDFKKITQEEADNFKNVPIEIIKDETVADKSFKYQSFFDHVVESALANLEIEDDSSSLFTGGYKIYTTLDTDVQSYMEDVYNNPNNFPGSNKDSIVQSAMVVLDHKTGEIRGLVGGRDQTGRRNFNRATQALRQPGSAFKPIAAYAPALEKGYSPASVLDDFPQAYKTSSGVKTFQNDDNRYRGLTPMRTSIQHSINVAAVKMLQEIGVDEGFDFAEKAGISSLVASGEKNDKGLSLALGGLATGASPLEMTSAYAVFANGGVYIPPHCITRIEDSKGNIIWDDKPKKERVMSEESAYLMTDMLQDVVNGGTGGNARMAGRQVAGKTGTTSFNVDVWFVGYTPELVGSVWMGYDKNDKMSGVSGGGSCAPIWRNVMVKAHENLPNNKFKKPENIVSMSIDTKSGMRPSSLTPSEFIKAELFNKKFLPKGTSDVWVEGSVCPVSGQLRTDNCPEAVSKSFLKRAKPWSTSSLPGNMKGIAPEDASLELPKEQCAIHGAGSVGISLSGQLTENREAVNLSWSWELAPEGTNYKVYRSQQAGFVPDAQTLIGNTNGGGFTDSGITKGQTYYYIVMAFDSETNTLSSSSNEIKITKPDNEPEGNTSLSAPKLRYQINNQTQVNLTWSKSGPDNQVSYFIFKSESPGFAAGGNSQIGSVSGTSLTDNNVETGKTYYYKVMGKDTRTGTETPISNEISVQIRGNVVEENTPE